MSTKENTKSFWNKLPVVILGAMFCCFLWGSASPAIKIGYQIFSVGPDDTPARIVFAGIRFTIAGMMVILLNCLQNKRLIYPKGGQWGKVWILSVFQTTVHYILFYMGMAHTSGVRGSIINAAEMFFSIFLAVVFFRFEKMTVRKAIGSLIGFLGVVLCVTGGSFAGMLEGGFSLAGEGALLVSAFCAGMASNLIKRIGATDDPVLMSGWQFLVGGVTLTLIGILTGGHLVMSTNTGVLLIIYMGFISAGAYTVWSLLLKYNPVSTVAVLGFMNPVFGVLLSVLFLHEGAEVKSWAVILALILVSLGIIVVNRKSKARS